MSRKCTSKPKNWSKSDEAHFWMLGLLLMAQHNTLEWQYRKPPLQYKPTLREAYVAIHKMDRLLKRPSLVMIPWAQSSQDDLNDRLSHRRGTLLDYSSWTSNEETFAWIDSATWHLLMESEINSTRHNNTWDLVELPKIWPSVQIGCWLKETSDSTCPNSNMASISTKSFH